MQLLLPNLMNALKGHNTPWWRRMEVKVFNVQMEKAKKLAKGNVNLMKIAKMKENFVYVMVHVACHASDLKKNVPNFQIHLMDKYT